jgi:hypothetical protein
MHNLLDFGPRRQSSPDWEERQVDGATPGSTPPSRPATPVTGATRPDDDRDTDDELDTPVRAGRNLLRGKRSAAGKKPAPKRAKKEPTSSQHNSALGNIAQHLLAANSQREKEFLQREREFQERRPSWKRAWELIQDNYKTEWAKLAPGALGCLHLALSQSPTNSCSNNATLSLPLAVIREGTDTSIRSFKWQQSSRRKRV